MQDMDSSITKIQKRNLTDMQEKFLDVLFGEAKGNPNEAARLAGYSSHSYPKVVRNLRKEITELATPPIHTFRQGSHKSNSFTTRRRHYSTGRYSSSSCQLNFRQSRYC